MQTLCWDIFQVGRNISATLCTVVVKCMKAHPLTWDEEAFMYEAHKMNAHFSFCSFVKLLRGHFFSVHYTLVRYTHYLPCWNSESRSLCFLLIGDASWPLSWSSLIFAWLQQDTRLNVLNACPVEFRSDYFDNSCKRHHIMMAFCHPCYRAERTAAILLSTKYWGLLLLAISSGSITSFLRSLLAFLLQASSGPNPLFSGC